ncbi:RTA1 like protein-domain-containing protein [Ampelomyces quisqualis]|uniref:RTA1 like protein-domain-containing protein n=1 Tax=Ampelomyces quisqualis TaxID=50730 RepID=A0A6A5QKK3_AMPQU|nr:RTA1 like protein-domain-containing protein [Ampelomyces quisqualis]
MERSNAATNPDFNEPLTSVYTWIQACTWETCGLKGSYWNYRPNKAINFAFAILFGLSALVFLTQGFASKKKWLGFSIAMVCGCVLEVIGYTGRILAWDDMYSQAPFLIQIICLTIAPAFLAAGIYLCLSRIVTAFGTSNSRISPRAYPLIFVTCDVVSLILQAAGGGIASVKTQAHEDPKLGNNIMIAGLSVQVATLLVFMLLALDFAVRTMGRVGQIGREQALDQRYVELRKNWAFKGFLIALALSTLCIFTRCVFRVAELSDGWSGHLMKVQGYFIGLEGAIIVVAAFLLNFFHPGLCFGETPAAGVTGGRKCWGGRKAASGQSSVEELRIREDMAQEGEGGTQYIWACFVLRVCDMQPPVVPITMPLFHLTLHCRRHPATLPRFFALKMRPVPPQYDFTIKYQRACSLLPPTTPSIQPPSSITTLLVATTLPHSITMNQDEDVEILLGHKRRYKFHSGNLARNSTLFAEMLTEPRAAALNAKAKSAGIKIKWLIELTHLPSENFPAGNLQLVHLNQLGERADGRSGMIVNENGRIPQASKVFAHYESIFYAFYGKDLTIDANDMAEALPECHSLLQISEYLGCTGIISKPIEVALLKHGQDLFRSIQSNPCPWVHVAYDIRSEAMFKECMIHFAGNWKNFKKTPAVLESVREIPGLRLLIEKYHRALILQGKGLELAIMSHYPGKMDKPSEDIPIKREAYSKDILVWMALSFFRHWVGQRLLLEKGRNGADCGYELYKAMGAAGEAYIDKTVINQFHTKFPMTKKAMNVLENHLFEIKECIKAIIEEHQVLVSTTQLDVSRFPVNYLTCTVFKKKDLPWLKDDTTPRVLPAKREYKPGGNEIARQNLETAKRAQARALFEDEDDEEDSFDRDLDIEESPAKRKRTD